MNFRNHYHYSQYTRAIREVKNVLCQRVRAFLPHRCYQFIKLGIVTLQSGTSCDPIWSVIAQLYDFVMWHTINYPTTWEVSIVIIQLTMISGPASENRTLPLDEKAPTCPSSRKTARRNFPEMVLLIKFLSNTCFMRWILVEYALLKQINKCI